MKEKKEKKVGRNKTGRFTDGNTFGGGKGAVKYSEKFIDKMIEYFDVPPTRTEYSEKFDSEGNVIERTPLGVVATDYPTFEGFAKSIGVTVRTLENWRNKYKKFADAHERATDMQRNTLIVNGLGGRYSPNFAKFIAVNHHKMTERIVEQHEVGEGYEISVTVREADNEKKA